jgi:hypothetical protein
MRLIDADALISALCLEDGEPQQYCFPCRKMFSAIRSAPTIPELTSEEIRELSSWSYGPFHKKIADWLQAESEGRLVVLPCKVGDTVYRIASGRVGGKRRVSYSGEYAVQEFKISCDYVTGNGLDMFAHMFLDDGKPATSYEIFSSNNIGKTVFLTREEAEATMKGAVDDERP